MTSKSESAVQRILANVFYLALLFATIFFFALPTASAQSIFANLSGTVTDTSGAVVSGAKVNIQNASTKVIRQLTTNNAGYFSATQLPTGTYTVTAEAKGFEKYQVSGIVLNSSDDKSLSISLKVGAENETVEVSATAGEVAITDSGEKSDLISAKELNDLSLVGRNATEYLKILPGAALSANGGVNRLAYSGEVVGINGFAVGNQAGGLAGVSLNGQTGQGIAITQDGQNVFDPGAAGSSTPVNPNPDMISEVKVLTSNFSSENMKGPIVVNTVTRSGGNSFHGDAHFYARNAAMNAEEAYAKSQESLNGFAPGQLKGPSSYYYPGFAIGGPILIPGTSFNKSRKKLFFFDSYENYRQNIDSGTLDRAFVPTTAMLNGDFSALSQPAYKSVGRFAMNTVPVQPTAGKFFGFDDRAASGCSITGGVMTSGCIDPNAQLLMKDFLPAPNLSTPDSAGFNYIAVVTEQQNSWQNVVRGDLNITDNTKVYVSWSRQRETANMPLGLWNNPGDWVVPAPSATIGANGSDFAAVNFVRVFSPTLTTEARFGYTKINFPSSPASPNKILRKNMNFPLTGIFSNPDAPAVLSWSQSIPTLGDIGHDYHPTMIAVKGIPSAAADVTKVFKTHTMKYGFYYEHTYNKQDNWGQFMGEFTYDPWNQISGNNYADMLMGIGNDGYFEQALPPPTNLAQNVAAFYAQDHWRLTRRIAVDYGMRFEHYAKPYANNPWGIAVFDPTAYAATTTGVNSSGIEWHSIDNNIPLSGTDSRLFFFSPRVGAAIDLFGTGRTVIRGGWGKFRAYDSVQSNDYTGPAQTAQGSVGWSCGFNVRNCATWEMLDTHASGNCTANTFGGTVPANCASAVVFGQVPNFANTSFTVASRRNDEQPLITSYSLTVDQQLPNRFRMELSYVGNHTDFMQGTVNINPVPLGTLNAPGFKCSQGGPSTSDPFCQQAYRPFSNYQNITESVTAGKAQYDALQASVMRSVGLLTLQANYTWAKALGDGIAVNNGGLSGALPDWGVNEYWGVLPLDRAHVFSAAYVLNVPKVHGGNALLRGAANGWQISGITQVESGSQLSSSGGGAGSNVGGTNLNFGLTGTAGSVALLGTPDVNLYPNLTCNPTQGLQKGQYVNPNCFSLPGAGQIGNGRIPYMAGPMFWNSDLTLLKNFKITEGQNVEFRIAAFNFLNHDLLSFNNGDNNLKLTYSGGVLTNATDTKHTCPGINCAAFGYADYHYGHRILELGVKYSF